MISILLLGGTRISLSTPYLREDRRGRRGRRRQKRHATGSGSYPVLEALGIEDRATPATRSELALHLVQTASYREAAQMLERRGLKVDVSTLVRVTSAVAEQSLRLRDAALEAARAVPIPADGPLARKRVRLSLDGGRVRTREPRRGRRTKKGRHSFRTPWREPRVLVIDLLDEDGAPDRLRLPLYDATLGNARASWGLLIGYLRLLGAAHAEVIEFIADGAPWIWDQIERLRTEAEIPDERIVEVIDFSHAAERLSMCIELIKTLPKAKRQRMFERLRHQLRHEPRGIEVLIETVLAHAVTRRGKAVKKALSYFDKHCERMRYADFDRQKLPVGSGQVESAVRRVVNLRFKAPGTFWTEQRLEGLLHLRAAFKAGRWDEVFTGVLTSTFLTPAFGVPGHDGSPQSAQVIELPQSKPTAIQRRKAS